MTDRAEQSGDIVFDGARLIRFAELLDASLTELRSIPQGSLSVEQLQTIVGRAVTEAEGVVPPALLPEFHSLIAPMRESETSRDLMVVAAELDGWIRGVLGTMGVTIAVTTDPDDED